MSLGFPKNYVKKIILDTNFLVAPFQLSIDMFDQLEDLYPYGEICTIDDAVQEAKSIEEGKYKDLVPQLIEKQDVKVLETKGEGNVDDLLVRLSEEYVIATNDKELKQRLLEKDAEVVIIRQKNYLKRINSDELG